MSYVDEEFVRQVEEHFKKYFNEESDHVFKSCGRIEFIGNHTDHNNGVCLVTSCDNMYMVAAAKANDSNFVRVKSDEYPEIVIDLNYLKPTEMDQGTSAGLVKGVISSFKKKGYKIGGLNISVLSRVPRGSGVSSSAAYSVLIGKILSYYYNNDSVNHVELAKFAQYAENNFFKKASGLLDQIGCISKGFTFVDFKDNGNPILENVVCPLDGYKLFIVDSRTDHQNLSDEYSSIPNDMKYVASQFGKNVLREVDYAKVLETDRLVTDSDLRLRLDRAIHFYKENERVRNCFKALKNNDIEKVCKLMTESGLSSENLLRNTTPKNFEGKSDYELVLDYLRECVNGGGARVHGGGFGGTLLALVKEENVPAFKEKLTKKVPADAIIEVRPSFDPLCLVK